MTLTGLVLLAGSLLYAAARLRGGGDRMTSGLVINNLLSYTALAAAVLLLRLDVPHYALWLGTLTVWLSGFMGHYLGKYTSSVWFDRCLHVFGSFSFALIVYCVIRSFAPEGGSVLFRALFVWALGGFVGAAFEVMEFIHDKTKGTRNQHGLQDTDTDLAANLIGGFLAGAFAFFFLLAPA